MALSPVGAEPARLVRVRQVHGCAVHGILRGEAAALAGQCPEADAIVSNEAGLALAVTVADCVPILMADGRTGASAAVHAGWRGTAAGVARAAVRAMRERFGTKPEDLRIALGPSIGPEDYEVGEALVDAFLAAGHARADVERWFRRGSRLRLDLWSANRDQLVAEGARPEHIFICGLSTLAHHHLFDSYRRDGKGAGRMAGIVVVPAMPSRRR